MRIRLAHFLCRMADRLEKPKAEPPSVYYAVHPSEHYAKVNTRIFKIQDGVISEVPSFADPPEVGKTI